MLRSVEDLLGYRVRGTDGDLGTVHDFYFDDQNWIIRYLVVDLGGFLSTRRVLLSTVPLGCPQAEGKVFPVLLTQDQVEQSPPVDVEQPVSRQMEEELHAHYGWSPYWRLSTPALSGGALAVTESLSEPDKEGEEPTRRNDPHLRSIREVRGYHIQAIDGEIGHVEDFITDDESWNLRYMVVDTRNWLPGRKVLVAPAWISDVNWVTRKVYVDLKREVIEKSPEFQPERPINREYEVRLYDYYGRPSYWTRL
ncbi:MAG: PRC-barrel domain-containing protein [Anaerolineae bacterium]